MSAIPAGVPFASMATKRTTAASDKEPVNVRIAGEILDRARDFIARQPVKPSLTALIETAMRDWLDRHHPKDKRK